MAIQILNLPNPLYPINLATSIQVLLLVDKSIAIYYSFYLSGGLSVMILLLRAFERLKPVPVTRPCRLLRSILGSH